MEKNLGDSSFKDKGSFCTCFNERLKYAEANPKEAASILDNDDGGQTEKHQVRMMGEIAKLTAGSNGALDPADYQRTVKALMPELLIQSLQKNLQVLGHMILQMQL